GDMVHPYLRRRHGEEPVLVPHPKLAQVLAKTLGVPIFQEQVMKLAVVAAGYTPGEADQLRRDMAAWRSQGKIEQHRERMVRRMVEGGIPADFAERVFSQIRGFGEYGFPESHAASFALLAYVTAWLKCHHPAAFLCALLNAQPMGFYTPASIIEDGKRRGVEVLPVDVRRSAWDSTLELTGDAAKAASGRRPHAVRVGLGMVKGFGVKEREAIAAWERPMEGLEDLVRRSGLSEPALFALAEAGALEAFGVNRRDALWRLRGLVRARGDALALGDRSQLSFPELGADDEVLWDYRASGHSTRGHPLRRFRPALEAQDVADARRLNALPDGAPVRYVGQVICRQRPQTASGVNFYTLEDETGLVNLVLWKQVAARHRTIAKTAVFLGVSGRIQRAHGVVHLVAERLFAGPEVLELAPAGQRHALVETARELGRRSRDFH
ncbi:MAG: OB-fold nucleic acid binding domain-containing protein, partial [Myxococcota bacterium]